MRAEAFRCPNCDAEYLVERVEAAPTHRQVQVVCVECGGPLRNREGKFALRYCPKGRSSAEERAGRKMRGAKEKRRGSC
jgi:predicted RNA-binding Zn-ribbon protein involved in translation (DUF1610 family)